MAQGQQPDPFSLHPDLDFSLCSIQGAHPDGVGGQIRPIFQPEPHRPVEARPGVPAAVGLIGVSGDDGELVGLSRFQIRAELHIGGRQRHLQHRPCGLESAGLNDWYIGVYGTPYPNETLLSQTWNKELAYRVGSAMAQEFADCEIYGWYGPAMNAHRSAFAGRNFEYYTEDGVLGGYIASNVVNAAAEKGVYAYIKHFVLNDQETNRISLLHTWSDEQCIREIYMKPFEIVVKNLGRAGNKPAAVMSSYNLIGHLYSGANPYLLNNVLRDEWGFQGMVLSDWDGSYGYQITGDCVCNGNDIMLGFNSYESNLMDTSSATMVKALRQASKNILFTVANNGYYTNETEDSGLDTMTSIFLGADIAIVAIAVGAAAAVTLRWRKKQAKSAR